MRGLSIGKKGCQDDDDDEDVVGADKAICFVRLGQGSRLSLNVASRRIKIKTRLFPLPPFPSLLLILSISRCLILCCSSNVFYICQAVNVYLFEGTFAFGVRVCVSVSVAA